MIALPGSLKYDVILYGHFFEIPFRTIGGYPSNKCISVLNRILRHRNQIAIDNTYILRKRKSLYAPDGIHVNIPYYPLWMNDMIIEADL